MSIYRTILEEELDMPILDDDNSPELKAIEDIVADQDANATEQDDAQEAAFGPSEGVSDIMDESAIIIAEAEMDFNKIMMAIGIYEASEMASGREVIYEAADIKGYLKKAKDWVVSFFKKVWQVLQRFVANFTSIFHTNKGLATKYKNQIQKGYDAYKKANNIENNEDWMSSLDRTVIGGYMKGVSGSNSDTKFGMTKEVADNAVRKYREKICKVECDAGEFREKLLEHLRGTEKKEGYMDPNTVLKVLENGKKVSACRKALDKAKKEYKDAIKKLNDLERSAAK